MAQTQYTKKLMDNLEKWRTEHNYSQAEFAKLLKISRSTYNKLLTGDITKISADGIKTIYEVTGYLCFELMEIHSDDFLRLVTKLHQFSPQELVFMNEFVDVYLESKRRINNDN